MRRGGIITARRRVRERGKRIRRCVLTGGLVLLFCALAMSDQLKSRIAQLMESGAEAVGAFTRTDSDTIQITLEEFEVYALQLGVFDSGERALSEQRRLVSQGVPCVIWQRDKMRLICSVAMSKEALDSAAAGGNEAYIVRDTLPEVRLQISCAKEDCSAAAAFVSLPDQLLSELLSGGGRPLAVILSQTRELAKEAIRSHPENSMYTGLAQSLKDWCDAAQQYLDQPDAEYCAAVMMCTLCREWRNALLNDYSMQAESTASAQRTPSTAAEVMPPA